MNKLFALYRTLRKSDAAKFADASKAADASADNAHSVSISQIATIVCVLVAMGGAGWAGYGLVDFFNLFGGISEVLSVLALVMGVLLAAKGLVQLINSLYMSTDTGLLITMPISPLALATVRLANVLASSWQIAAGALLAFSLGYCLRSPTGLAFWIGICLYIALVPLFVTLVAAVLTMLLMSVFRAFRSRNAMKYIGVFGMLLVVIAYACWIAASSSDIDIGKLLGTALNIGRNFTQLVPVVPFIHAFMDTGSPLQALLALLVTAASALAFVAATRALYLRSVVNMQDAGSSSRRFRGRALERVYEAKKPSASYRRKELLLLRRNPVYLLKNFLITFGWPVILVPMLLFASMNQQPVQEIPEEVAAATQAPGATVILLLTLGLVVVVVLLVNLFSDIAYSSITREGSTFAALKQLPLSCREQVRAKRDVARNIVGIATIGYLTVAAVAGAIYGVVPWYAIPYGLAVGLPVLHLVVDIDMICGIRNANLNWDNESAAIRKKAGLTLGSYLLMVLVLVGLAALYAFLDSHSFPVLPCLLTVPLLLIAAAVLTDRRMYRLAEAKLPEL